MNGAEYRIESSHRLVNRLLPGTRAENPLIRDRALAVALAAKSFTRSGEEIRVVHVPTGEVVFRKTTSRIDVPEEL